MAAPKKNLIWIALLLLLLWLLLRKKSSSSSGRLSGDLSTGKVPAAPLFGTDNIIDVADATATLPLPAPPVLLPPPAPADPPIDWGLYIGKIS